MFKVFCALGLFVGLVGCETTPPLAPDIVVCQEVMGKTNDGYKRVQLSLTNRGTAVGSVQYRIDWKDDSGMKVIDPDHDGWENVTLNPGNVEDITSIAPKKTCETYRLSMEYIWQ